jgi:hypothetical protein
VQPTIARLRDGTAVGAWLFKASPSVWDIGTALATGVELDWWRLAPTYRAGLVHAGHPCAVWVTRGDDRVRSGVWAIGEVTGEPRDDVGDPDDPLWVDDGARRQVRPMVPVRLEVLESCLGVEAIRADPRLERAEILRVPRIGNPAALTPGEWEAVRDLAGPTRNTPTRVV